MKLRCNFKVEKWYLEQRIKDAKNSDPYHEFWLRFFENSDEIHRLTQNTRYDVLLILAIIGLLGKLPDEEKALEFLENLLEIDATSLSPGSKLIN